MSVTLHRFSLDDYQRMIETGILGKNRKVELIEGEIISMAPMGQEHIFGILSYNQRLVQTYSQEALVLVQCPIQIFPDSEPEPDFVLLKPPIQHYANRKPRAEDVLLLIELSHSTLEYDRNQKLSLYAKAAIPEVWIHNFQENILRGLSHTYTA